jgi:23S rRNA pseudoU1915 N3-methylase RlmH
MSDEPTQAASELARIQRELKAPKNLHNKFGGYQYRNCESILEGLKKVKGDCSVVIHDDLVMVGDRYYVKATAVLLAPDGSSVKSTAFAREAADKKGMDVAMVTGATSSYARKYALNALFAIDDTADNDHESVGEDTVATIDKELAEKIEKDLVELDADIAAFESYMGCKIAEITSATLPKANAAIAAKRKKAAKAESALDKLAKMAEEAQA